MHLCRLFRISLAVSCALILTGCISTPPANASYHAEKPSISMTGPMSFERCQSEVNALSQYDETSYQRQHDAMSALLDRSAKYLLTRPQLTEDMQLTLDSVFQAELAKRCQQIHAELFRAMLAQAGEM